MKISATVWFKRAISALAFVLPVSALAQSIYIYPSAATATRGTYQTVTAVVTGVNDKTVTWSTDGGTIVGTNPCVVNEPCTVALYTTNTGTYHLTATSNVNHAITATSAITFTGSPTPATTHPRLGGITAGMLPQLRAKAVASNPMYMTLYNRAADAYNSDSAIWSWSCNGGSGQPNSDQTENFKEGDAYLFAFMSMVDPNNATYKWGCYGRDIWMYYANFWLNPLSATYSAATLSQRQNDANYGLTGNHGADMSEALTLTPDWLIAGGYLIASDLATTRAYLALAAKQAATIPYTGTRAPIGGYNSPSQFDSGSVWDFGGQRAMGNNYTHSKILYLTAASLTFNDNTTDDPALANSCGAARYDVCPDGTAGSLHAYWKYLSGAMLYKDWAHMEDPAVSFQAYQTAFSNLSTVPTCEDSATGTQVSCFGDGRGGESSEGSWYQYSMYRLQLALLSISSAGYNDPILYGPQMSLTSSSWWDMKAVSDLEFLTYSYYTPQPRFAFFSTGDTMNLYRAPSDFNAEAWMLVSDSVTGRTDRTATLEWPLIYSSIGGVPAFYSNLGNGYGSNNAIPLFVASPAGDLTATAPADPRAKLPVDLYNAGNQHIFARSGWDTNGTESASWGDGGNNTVFSYYCPNTRIDHEHEVCGGFDLLSGGEYITKTRTVFNNYNMMLASAEHSNEASYQANPSQTVCTMAAGCFAWQAVQGSDGKGGGELWHGYQGGSTTLAHAELPGYVAAVVDTTNLYNGSSAVGWGSISGITAASRSLIYLRGSNQVIYYDRGSGAANSKRLWATTTGAVTVSSNTASWPTRSGKQKVYLTSLLPAGATVSDGGAYMTNENGMPGTSDWEPYSRVLIDAGAPATTQFLSVMEWGSSSLAKTTTQLVQSSAGQSFDGAVVGSSLVMFMRSWPASFTGVTYPASGATTQYVSDLTPNTKYSISGTGAPTSGTTDNAGVLTFTAAGTGSISISTGPAAAPVVQLQSITMSPASATVQANSTQQYSATCQYSDGSSSNCTGSVTWSSDSSTVAIVNTSGLATGVGQGTANIMASSGSVQGQASITVPAATLQSITVSPASATINVGGTQQLKATGVYSDASTVDMTSTVAWSSSNSSIVSTTAAGVAAGLSQGSASVVATSGSVHGQAGISVVQTAAPTFTPGAGTYTSAQTVTISTTTTSATIYYTTNGTTPTTNSAVYSGPITVSMSETLQAIAVANGSSASTAASATYTITSPASAPVFSPAGGTYTSGQTVTMSTSTPSATIYYTTDGSTPTSNSAVYTSAISVPSSETVKAIAVASGYSASTVSAAVYTINIQTAATPTFSPAGGKYTSAQNVSISSATAGAVIHYTTDGTTPTVNSTVYSGPISVASSMTLRAIATATGYTTSGVGSATYTISMGLAATPVLSPAPGRYTSIQTVTVTTSTPSAIIYYTMDGSKPTTSSPVYTTPITVAGSMTIKAFAVSSTTTSSSTASGNYTLKLPAVATPTFSPSGGKYTSIQTVSITSSTPDSTIYFTTDGTIPTTSSQMYSGPITVGTTETVKAIAVETGYNPSSVGSASYTITLPSPTFSLKASSSSVTVTRGHASITNVQVIPENGFSAPVELSCSGLPSGAACSFAPGVVIPPGSPSSTVLTISAPAEVASNSNLPSPRIPSAASLALLGFCSFRRKKGKAYRLLSMAVFGAIALSLCTGCGGRVNYTPESASVVTIVGVHDSMQPTTTLTLTVL